MRTKAAGNWNTDMGMAPKDGSVLLLLTLRGVPVTAFWSKCKIKKESAIVVPNAKLELIDHEAWISSVGPGVLLTDPMVAWSKIYFPDIKFKDPPFDKDGKILPYKEIEREGKLRLLKKDKENECSPLSPEDKL